MKDFILPVLKYECSCGNVDRIPCKHNALSVEVRSRFCVPCGNIMSGQLKKVYIPDELPACYKNGDELIRQRIGEV